MSWRIEWHPAALHGFNALPMATATRLDAAVIRFAETGRGDVERHRPHDPTLFRIRVRGALAVFRAVPETGTIRVFAVYPRR